MLEKAITALSEGINRLAAAIEAGGVGGEAAAPGKAAPGKAAPKKTVAAKKTTAKKKPAAKKGAGKPATTKKQVSDLVLKLAEQNGRDDVVEILAEFDAEKVSELEPSQYDEIAESLRAALGTEEEPEEEEEEPEELEEDEDNIFD